jgi:hypothetical protein
MTCPSVPSQGLDFIVGTNGLPEPPDCASPTSQQRAVLPRAPLHRPGEGRQQKPGREGAFVPPVPPGPSVSPDLPGQSHPRPPPLLETRRVREDQSLPKGTYLIVISFIHSFILQILRSNCLPSCTWPQGSPGAKQT